MKSLWLAAVCMAVSGMAVSGVAHAAMPGPRDPDWPCQSIKVPSLSVGALWSGPAIDAYAATWQQDKQVADLVARLAQRRVPIEQAKVEIAVLAAGAGAQKQAKLLGLFAGLFHVLDEERTAVQDGLDRYGRRQKQLADQVRAEADSLRTQQAATTPDPAQIDQLTQRLTWDTRVFEDRRQSLSYACDVPNVIEQRLFTLSQAIQQALQ